MSPLVAGALGLLLLIGVLWDAFETVVLPRRVIRPVRLTRLFYRATWIPSAAVARRLPPGAPRESFLAFYGPLSLLFLLWVWAVGLVVGFAFLYGAVGSDMRAPEGHATWWTGLYMSGTTFFTLGLGDVTPHAPASRLLAVLEAGTGFGFLAIVISYLPVLYQAFSRRERSITLLDSRAGSPPTASTLLERLAPAPDPGGAEFFSAWEEWAADVLETHLSYPVLSYFRSQHDNQSWLAALAVVLDASALTIATRGEAAPAARRTFVMARHAAIDLAHVFGATRGRAVDRLPPEDCRRLAERLRSANVAVSDVEVEEDLAALRGLYEPHLAALSDYLLMPLPRWVADDVPGELAAALRGDERTPARIAALPVD